MIAVMKRAVILKMWNRLCLVPLLCTAEGMPKCTDAFGRERAVQYFRPLHHPAVIPFLGARTVVHRETLFFLVKF